MLFNTFQYFAFFVITILIYFIIPSRIKTIWLLIASYFFYGSWNIKYTLLMLSVTFISYVAGVLISNGYRFGLWLGISLLIIILLVFKYFNFLLGNVNTLTSILDVNMTEVGLVDIVLPVGISFYVFQAISYIVDVYRDNECFEKNFIRYALYISFFPQLVAGPIERSDKILRQLRHIELGNVRFEYDRFINGLQWIVYGLFLKMVIADRVAILVDKVFSGYSNLSSISLFAGMIGFSIQIYCDFAGYSLIACGSALVIGIELIENFRAPYFSQSVSEFWRRWHVSLSTWFRDYVYIPMGGNRCSKIRNSMNILLTMLLSGLWHGAAWHYVVWGGIHGCAQVFERILGVKKEVKNKSNLLKVLRIISVVLFISIAWIFFRANSLSDAVMYIKRMITEWNINLFFSQEIYNLGLSFIEYGILVLALIIMLVVDRINYKNELKEYEFVNKNGTFFKWFFNFVLIVFIVVFGVYGTDSVGSSFIYFQF